MSVEKGNLSINSDNILPIIKKWLYSDKDIFIRELISNASDAVTKLKKLSQMGEATVSENEKFRIDVIVDKENSTITVSDNGIGMTASEIKQYINQIAFSGATDFLNKYKDKVGQEGEIIGHFGLGFYSAFMVSDVVTIDTLSYQEGETAARWICNGGIDYEMDEGSRTERGTSITLTISEDGKEFLDIYNIRNTIKKYCSFMPVEIFLIDANEEVKEEVSQEVVEGETPKEETKEEEKPLNNTEPLWLKQPKDCTDDEYKAFYRDVFFDFNEPLFWIHLNMDYPVRLKGILYFPKLKSQMDPLEGQVKLYNNQVYVADNIKEVIPEFLLLLKGCIDCPDLPLNVSRSFLQNDGYAKKMSGYIVKKVADKLKSVYKSSKEDYEKFWDDISIFIKYGCLKEDKFYEKVKEVLIYKTTKGVYKNLETYLADNSEKHEKEVFYVSDETQQAQYISMFNDEDMEAVILSSPIDTAYISYLEMKEQQEGTTFKRIDSDISSSLKQNDDSNEEIEKAFKEIFVKELNKEKLIVKAQTLKSEKVAGVILLSEQQRRMEEMQKMFGGNMPFPMENEETLVLNLNNKLVKKLMAIYEDESKKDDVNLILSHIYDLALISHKPLTSEEMTKFIERSNTILERIV